LPGRQVTVDPRKRRPRATALLVELKNPERGFEPDPERLDDFISVQLSQDATNASHAHCTAKIPGINARRAAVSSAHADSCRTSAVAI